MVCYHPVQAFLPFSYDNEGKRRLIFSKSKIYKTVILPSIRESLPFGEMSSDYYFEHFYPEHPVFRAENFHVTGELSGCYVNVPCGQCIGCKNDYARRWSVRATHEAFMHNHYKNCAFVTLTFSPEGMKTRTCDNPHSLDKVGIRSWLKRFRERVRSEYHCDIRYLLCGEYGSKHGRPHYHILFYGFNFPDSFNKVFRSYKLLNGRVVKLRRSNFLEDCWRAVGSDTSFGFSVVSDVNFESASYTCRYVMKKSGTSKDKYNGDLEKEFQLVSRNPGLGSSYFDKYYKEIMANGKIDFAGGRVSDIPRYYIDRLKTFDIDLYNKYKNDCLQNLINNLYNPNPEMSLERLRAKEELLLAKLGRYKRDYEENIGLDKQLSILHNI